MWAATLRGMIAHKLRLVLTTASIALGVAFLAGTLVLTDTMGLAFEQLFGKVAAGTDAVVRTQAPYAASEDVGTSRAPIAAATLAEVNAVDGVRVAEGFVSGYALMTDNEGRAVLGRGGAPTVGSNLAEDETLRGDVELLSGAAPAGVDEVAIDATSAEDHQIALGSTITVLFHGPPQEFTVVGTVGFAGEKDLGGTTSAYFDTSTAQRFLGMPGMYDSIGVSAETGVSQEALAERLGAVVPAGAEAVTGTTVAQENADTMSADLRIVNILFMVFAGVALFVGAFIIWNTFTMIVTQRSREIALLRAIGATRRQVMRNLMLEAVVLGLAASALGIVLGVGVAQGLRVLMELVGLALPTTTLQLEPRTIWVSLLVGTLVTVVAAVVPARRATQVLPVEALRDATPGAENPSARRVLSGAALLTLGIGGMTATLVAGVDARVLGLGVLLVMVGVMVSLPFAVRPLAAAIAAPLRARGLPGELAQQNAVRNPRRTASTAAALMIGLTLVVSMGVLASSLKASFGGVLAERLTADLFVTIASSQGAGFSASVIDAVAAVPGVERVSASGFGQARFEGAGANYSSVDPATAESMMNLPSSSGATSDLDRESILVSEGAATKNGWEVGDTVTATFAASGSHPLRIAGIYEKGWIQEDYVISRAGENAMAGPQLVSMVLVALAAGEDREAMQHTIGAALTDHPDALVRDQQGFEKMASGFLDTMLTFVTVMLLLAVLIALLGIVNTLALSVYERTRELGLLRAVGMTRTQVRAMVRWESVVISLIGALSGAVLGVGIGLAASQALQFWGVNSLSVPWVQVTSYVALAAVAGVLAAIGPARTAAKVDVLKAVVTE
jgi:putative ABC transport system permease protein